VYIVTFYSYRGGVGRTTALVNVGFDLARRGWKVLLVDFDLESPGLTYFPRLRGSHPGIVEYVTAYRERGESPDVRDYLYPVEIDGQKDRLWVMPAGGDTDVESDPAYWEALAGIDWQELYDRQDGYLFFEDTRAQWEQLAPDFVLIDTHAGITPALGISTRQLPDAVVHMYNSRHGGIGGLDEMYSRISDEKQTRGKSIEQYHVAIGVVEADDEEASCHEDWDAAIPFSHRLLLEKQVIVVSNADSRLAKAYCRLTNRLIAANNVLIAANFAQDRDGALLLLRKLLADPSMVIGGLALSSDYSDALDQIIDVFSDDAAILAQAACCLYGAARYGRALEVLDRALDLRPDSPELLWQRASYRRRLNWPGAVKDLLKLLDECDPQKRGWSPPAEQDRLRSVFDPWVAVDWRFDLPTKLRDGASVHVSDYSESRLSFPGIDPYVASAVSQLRQLSREDYEGAKRKPAVAALSSDAQAILFGERPPDDPHTLIEARNTLIGARKWKEAVDLLTPRFQQSDNWSLEDSLCLFMAWWGLEDEKELQTHGKKVRDQFAHRGTNNVSELQMLALVYWKTGSPDLAEKILDLADEKVTALSRARLFSYCRLAEVSGTQYHADSADMRQLFRGAAIPPPFLGKEPSGR